MARRVPSSWGEPDEDYRAALTKPTRRDFEREYLTTWEEPKTQMKSKIIMDPAVLKAMDASFKDLRGATDATKSFREAAAALAASFGSAAPLGGLASLASLAGAPTGPTGPVTAEELIRKMTDAKKAMEAPSPGPGDKTGWKLTSVRWLRERRSEYLRIAGADAHTLLKQALGAMSYMEADAAHRDGALDREAAARMREEVLARWDQEEHKNMVAYLEAGGLAEKMRLLGKAPKAKATTLDAHVPEWPYKADPKAAAEQELAEAVAHLTNPSMGSW